MSEDPQAYEAAILKWKAQQGLNRLDGITPTARRVGFEIIACLNIETGRCDPSELRLAALCVLSLSAVQKAKKELREKHLLLWENKGGVRKRSAYVVNLRRLVEINDLAEERARKAVADGKWDSKYKITGKKPNSPGGFKHGQPSGSEDEGKHGQPSGSEDEGKHGQPSGSEEAKPVNLEGQTRTDEQFKHGRASAGTLLNTPRGTLLQCTSHDDAAHEGASPCSSKPADPPMALEEPRRSVLPPKPTAEEIERAKRLKLRPVTQFILDEPEGKKLLMLYAARADTKDEAAISLMLADGNDEGARHAIAAVAARPMDGSEAA